MFVDDATHALAMLIWLLVILPASKFAMQVVSTLSGHVKFTRGWIAEVEAQSGYVHCGLLSTPVKEGLSA